MTQPIMSQANFSVSGAIDTIVDTAKQAAQWLGRAVVYLKDFVIEYATKAWQLGTNFFSAAADFVMQHSQAFTIVGATLGVATAIYALSKVFSKAAPVTGAARV